MGKVLVFRGSIQEALEKLNPGYRDRKDSGLCTTCGVGVDPAELADELSRKEFRISGMCRRCQDLAFAPGPEDVDD